MPAQVEADYLQWPLLPQLFPLSFPGVKTSRDDVVVDIDAAIEKKIEAISCHVSQFFEWLPYNARILHEVPAGEDERRTWLRQAMERRFGQETERFRAKLLERYGAEHSSQVQFAEAFELCEYGAALTPEMTQRLFSF